MAEPSFAPAFELETPVVHGEPVLAWLAASCERPDRFREVLEQRARALGIEAAKSRPGAGTDLYHDLIGRHLGSARRALRVHVRAALSGAGRWDELSFDELHARCGYRASWWAARGVGPGAVVAIVLPFGIEAVVSLCAALRLGAIASWLEPQGTDFVIRRLTALAPTHVVADPFVAGRLGKLAELVLPPDALTSPTHVGSHTYPAGEIALALSSPLRTPPDPPVKVPAEAVYAGALRDALACLVLRPGDAIAAPGFHSLQHQPALLFAAWIAGAAYLHLEEDDAVREPALLDASPLRAIGVTPRVRDAYLAARRGHRPPWTHVIRNPEERCDWEAWQAFVDGCELADVAFSNLVVDAAAGGALLSSVRRPGRKLLAHLQSVLPAPGRRWQLIDFTGSGQPSAADAGVYAPLDDGKKPKPIEPRYLVLAGRRGEYLYGGTMQPRRAGRVYPVDEVLAVAARAELLDGAAVAAVVSGGSASEARFVLVGFTGDQTADGFDAALAARRAELERLLAGALGAELLPDRIELYPLYARRAKGAVDLEWAVGQYLGGVLFRKTRAPIFRRLAGLRRSLRAAAAAPVPISEEAR